MKSNCSLCNEFTAKDISMLPYTYSKEMSNRYGIVNRLLYEDKDFVIIPSLGPISECHLLVLPKTHMYSYALMPLSLLKKAEELIDGTARIVEKIYGNSIIFEHGTWNEEMTGSASCNHAHMHIVSCRLSILPLLKKDGLNIRKIESLSEIVEQKERKLPYFYYSEGAGKTYIMDDTVHKSQYMRILFSEIQGMPERGDWKKNWGIVHIDKMLVTLKKELQDVLVERN